MVNDIGQHWLLCWQRLHVHPNLLVTTEEIILLESLADVTAEHLDLGVPLCTARGAKKLQRSTALRKLISEFATVDVRRVDGMTRSPRRYTHCTRHV